MTTEREVTRLAGGAGVLLSWRPVAASMENQVLVHLRCQCERWVRLDDRDLAALSAIDVFAYLVSRARCVGHPTGDDFEDPRKWSPVEVRPRETFRRPL